MVTTDTAQTISGHKIFNEGVLDVASPGNTGNAIRLYNAGIGIYDKGTNNTRKAYIRFPRTTGDLALTSDIPTDYVSLTGDQTINGKKTYTGGVTAANFTAQGSNQSTIYGGTQFVHTFANNTKLNLQFPSKTGNKTIATTDDIPSYTVLFSTTPSTGASVYTINLSDDITNYDEIIVFFNLNDSVNEKFSASFSDVAVGDTITLSGQHLADTRLYIKTDQYAVTSTTSLTIAKGQQARLGNNEANSISTITTQMRCRPYKIVGVKY